MSTTEILVLDFANIEAVEALFNKAFQHPEQTYIIQPVNSRVASAWLSEFTSMVNFTWCAGVRSFESRLQDVGPLHYSQLIDLDMLYYRNRCGYAAGNYHCDHPEHPDAELCTEDGCEECAKAQPQSAHKCLCFANSCPIASQANREDIRKLDPALWESDYKDSDYEPEDWMILYKRPRYAYVPNITVLGCEHVNRN